jgi:hypothetical protein
VLSAQNSNARQNYLDRLTKWPGKGKAVEHAQQNVKMAARLRVQPLAWEYIYTATF